MTKPIYKVYIGKNSAMYQMSAEDRKRFREKLWSAVDQAGGKTIIHCGAMEEQWHYFGVEEWPDLDSLQKFNNLLHEIKLEFGIDWECMSFLGTKPE